MLPTKGSCPKKSTNELENASATAILGCLGHLPKLAEALLPGWTKIDSASGTYYYNCDTKRSTWDKREALPPMPDLPSPPPPPPPGPPPTDDNAGSDLENNGESTNALDW